MPGGGVVGDSFLRQLSGREVWDHPAGGGSNRWSRKGGGGGGRGGGGGGERSLNRMEGVSHMGEGGGGGVVVKKKRVMVVIDHTPRAKRAMMWAVTHVANKGDIITLLHVIVPPRSGGGGARRNSSSSSPPQLAGSLGSLCKACKPEVEVEALVIQGPKLPTVLSQVKKLEASVLVLGQSKPSPLCCLFRSSSSEDFVEQCINKAECLALAVRKRSGGVGGYLISTRWQKNFWLLA